MATIKPGFDDFIKTVDEGCVGFVTELHGLFMDAGCTIGVKEAKSGYVVSYLWNKKTVANYVFRKKGLLIRIYANHIAQYMEVLETLPGGMKKELKKSPNCKRLLDPTACNSKCAMGYDYMLEGERMQKCRNSAFFFLLCDEYHPYIKELVRRELAACQKNEAK